MRSDFESHLAMHQYSTANPVSSISRFSSPACLCNCCGISFSTIFGILLSNMFLSVHEYIVNGSKRLNLSTVSGGSRSGEECGFQRFPLKPLWLE